MDAETQKQEAEFLAGFSGESAGDAGAPAADTAAEAQEQEQGAETGKAEGQETGADEGEGKTADEVAELVAGFTPDELKNLLARAAKVDSLEKEVRKLHGKYGELNGLFHEQRGQKEAPAKTPELPPEIAQIEQDYPDLAAYVKAMVPTKEQEQQQVKELPEARAEGAPADIDLQLVLMDHLHEGWREKMGGQDFQLWLASQSDETKSTYDKAVTAKQLSDVLGKFDAWQTGREERATKGKQRLEQALTPSGSAGKPKTAPSPEDQFLAGFKSVMAR